MDAINRQLTVMENQLRKAQRIGDRIAITLLVIRINRKLDEAFLVAMSRG